MWLCKVGVLSGCVKRGDVGWVLRGCVEWLCKVGVLSGVMIP